jgi:hypothetical protein
MGCIKRKEIVGQLAAVRVSGRIVELVFIRYVSALLLPRKLQVSENMDCCIFKYLFGWTVFENRS